MFTDYYAEASCTAGRANFITGEMPLRTGLTTVGQAGADIGMPDQAVTLATVLKSLRLRNRAVRQKPSGRSEQVPADSARLRRIFRLPLSPRRDVGPLLVRLPAGLDRQYGPRDLIHSYATDTDNPAVQPRWGKVGKQRIVDEGPLAPFPNMAGRQNWQEGRKARYDMETFDDVLVKGQRLHG